MMIINNAEEPRTFVIAVDGLAGVSIDSEHEVEVGGGTHRLFAVRVRAEPDTGEAGSNTIHFVLHTQQDPDVIRREKASFFLPRDRN
jgi:hypothetical protein